MYPTAHEKQISSLHWRHPTGQGFFGVIELSIQNDPFSKFYVSANPAGQEVKHLPWYNE